MLQKQKIYLVSFADQRLGISALRFQQQAQAMEIFDDIFIYTESSLPLSFKEKFKDKLYVKKDSGQVFHYNAGKSSGLNDLVPSRGFGYWCWKPQVILMVLEQILDGDLLLYLDIGFEFNTEKKDELQAMFEKVNTNEFMGVLHNITHRKYQKGDTLAYYGLLDDEEFLNSKQVAGGMIFMKKSLKTQKIITEWLEIFTHHYNFVDDSPSCLPNKDFEKNLHDQSILGILAYKYKIANFGVEYYDDRFNKPLLCRRNKIYLSNNVKETNYFSSLFTIFQSGHSTVHVDNFLKKYKALEQDSKELSLLKASNSLYSAKNAIINHLSYQLGFAMVRHSKSLLGLLKLPFLLLCLKIAHQHRQKIFKEQGLHYRTLEKLSDYKEALKVQQHLSYRLGSALIKDCKGKNFLTMGGGYYEISFLQSA
ncbi:hypothetical protein OQH60_05625 [Campylobacter sp. MIT 21-1685]|uniref:hypothetical protein n=1 Tax=Campylobacter sp. MIT 21-1685 TaxID=2994323 RepID=UPI00224B6C96|nr:hypothetical protein [Campylobacter sp. MIT 21-1685]MCX2807826.1 hypothetical protein [Campylobacter sp. MIT 21-1685]